MGEHLPCKQGVMSSNLSISIAERDSLRHTYLENRILNEDLIFYSNIKTSEAVR